MKRIVLMALTGWAAIVWLAYTLADRRVGWCSAYRDCIERAQITRDNVLVWGAIIALLGLIVAAVIEWRATRGQGPSSANPAGKSRLLRAEPGAPR